MLDDVKIYNVKIPNIQYTTCISIIAVTNFCTPIVKGHLRDMGDVFTFLQPGDKLGILMPVMELQLSVGTEPGDVLVAENKITNCT